MKKLLILAALIWAADASARTVGNHLVVDELVFRSHKDAQTDPNAFSDLATKDAVDSSVTQRLGTAISVLDTTGPIKTSGWGVITNQALSDTNGFYCQFNLRDAQLGADGAAALCESGADSIYVAAQGSMDGKVWFTLPTFKCGTKSSIASRLDQANVTGAFFGALTLNGAALSTGAPAWRILYKQRAVSCWDNLDVGGINYFPYLRWIVGFPDAKGYKVRASVTHVSSEE